MKILLYLVSFFLAVIGAIIFLAGTLDPDIDYVVKTLIIFISSLFLVPSFLIFKKNRGETINFVYVRFVSLYTFSIIFALGALSIFVNVYRFNSDFEAQYCLCNFSILFFWLKRKDK